MGLLLAVRLLPLQRAARELEGNEITSELLAGPHRHRPGVSTAW